MKQCGTRSPAKHLANAIEYIMSPEKTQNGYLIGGVNCIPDYALKQMLQTKRHFGKTDQRQGYHFVISFAEGEVTPEQAYEIVSRFTNEYLGKEYEAIYAVHDNTEHIHGHIIFNSVSFLNGRKYRYVKGDWEKYIQPIVNRLCEEYELSTIDLNMVQKNKKKEWDRSRNGTFIWSNMVSMDVEDALSFATDFKNFLSLMELKGYEIKQGKHISVRPRALKRFCRLDTIDKHYTEEILTQRIIQEEVNKSSPPKKRNPAPKILAGKGRYNRIKRRDLSPYQKKYFAELYQTGQLRKRPYSQVWKYKDEIKKFHQLQEQYLYIIRMNITSKEDLHDRQIILDKEQKELDAERRKYYQKRYPYKEMLSKVEQMEAVLGEVKLYEEGEADFKKEYEIFLEGRKQLDSLGINLEQAVGIRDRFEEERSKINQRKREIGKEQKLCEGIAEESARQIPRKIQGNAMQKSKTSKRVK